MHIPMFFTLLLVSLFSVNSWSANFHAESFVKEKCTGCHDSSVYTRSNRRVNSLPRLKTQVQMCDAQLGIKLFNEEVDAVVTYLNDNYYHFDK